MTWDIIGHCLVTASLNSATTYFALGILDLADLEVKIYSDFAYKVNGKPKPNFNKTIRKCQYVTSTKPYPDTDARNSSLNG